MLCQPLDPTQYGQSVDHGAVPGSIAVQEAEYLPGFLGGIDIFNKLMDFARMAASSKDYQIIHGSPPC
jgi:hypothetical protein